MKSRDHKYAKFATGIQLDETEEPASPEEFRVVFTDDRNNVIGHALFRAEATEASITVERYEDFPLKVTVHE